MSISAQVDSRMAMCLPGSILLQLIELISSGRVYVEVHKKGHQVEMRYQNAVKP